MLIPSPPSNYPGSTGAGPQQDSITDSMDASLSELRELVMDRQGGLACCNSWGRKESDMTE